MPDEFKRVQRLSPAKCDNHPDERRRERRRARRVLKRERLKGEFFVPVTEMDGIELNSVWHVRCEMCEPRCHCNCDCMCHGVCCFYVKELRPHHNVVIMSAMNTKFPDEDHDPGSVRRAFKPVKKTLTKQG